jgi:undecaprenyl-diphosphatase
MESIGIAPFIGMAVAAIVGYAALKLLIAILHRGNFIWFSLYCFLLGIYAIIFV